VFDVLVVISETCLCSHLVALLLNQTYNCGIQKNAQTYAKPRPKMNKLALVYLLELCVTV